MAEYYIDPDWTGTESGTKAEPYNDWATEVQTALADDDTVYINRGTTLTLSAQLLVDHSGVTLKPYGTGANPIIDGNSGNFYTIYNAAANCVYEDLDIRNGGHVQGMIVISSSGDSPTFTRCSFNGAVDRLVWALWPFTFTDCTFTHANAQELILLQDAGNGSGGSFSGCTFTNTAASKGAATRGIDGGTSTWDDLTVTNCVFGNTSGGELSTGIYMGATSDNWTIEGCTLIESLTYGIFANDGDGHVIRGNDCSGGPTGIYIANSANVFIERGTISDCTEEGVRVAATTNLRILNVTFNDIWDGTAYPSGNGNGVEIINGAAAGTVIEGCTFRRCYRGILDDNAATTGTTIKCNLLIDCYVNGIDMQATGTGQNLIYNNTVDHAPTGTAGHGIVVQSGGANTDVVIKYNDVACGTTGTNIQALAIGGTYSSVEIDANNYQISNSAVYGALGGTDYSSLSAWQSALTGDANVSGNETNALEVDSGWDSNYMPTHASIISGGTKWWTGPNPAGPNEPLSTWETSLGAVQSQDVPFHPKNL